MKLVPECVQTKMKLRCVRAVQAINTIAAHHTALQLPCCSGMLVTHAKAHVLAIEETQLLNLHRQVFEPR